MAVVDGRRTRGSRAFSALYGVERHGAFFYLLAPAVRADHDALRIVIGGQDFRECLVAGWAKEFALLHKTAVQCGSC